MVLKQLWANKMSSGIELFQDSGWKAQNTKHDI